MIRLQNQTIQEQADSVIDDRRATCAVMASNEAAADSFDARVEQAIRDQFRDKPGAVRALLRAIEESDQ